jgi:hypothetical protein
MLMLAPLFTGARRLRATLTALLLTALATLVLSVVPAAQASARTAPAAVPRGFVGVDIDGPLFSHDDVVSLNNQMSSMVSNGIESVRVAFNWAAAQPYSSWSQVPAGDKADFVTGPAGRPISYTGTDAVVADAARHGLTVLPTLLYAPGWDAAKNPHGFNTPKRNAPFAEFAAAMVHRYGPHGSFWSQNKRVPRQPIHMWQVWNEPNIAAYWRQPFAKSYVSLLSLTHRAIKQADRSAKVVLGALTNLAWHSIGQVYSIRGARNLFDVVSVNGFTSTPAKVILYLRLMRHAMDHYKDATKPLIATELSWPSAKGQTRDRNDFDTTENGQARDIAQLLPLIGAWRTRIGLSAFYYYTWMGTEFRGAGAFSFSGLLRFTQAGKVRTKPALGAFRKGALALEHCRSKGKTATRCRR